MYSIRGHGTRLLLEPLELAIIKATQAHAGQRDADGSLHILHCMSVLERVQEIVTTGTDKQFAPHGISVEGLFEAAVLHDTVEDSDVTLEEIRSTFGELVATIVDGVTRRKSESYRDFIYRAKAHPGARIVKIADLSHNCSRTNKIPKKKVSWAQKLDYKYRIASAVLRAPWEPTWEAASHEVQYDIRPARHFIADPNGKRIEITAAEAKKIKISFSISN
jgi:(p)ppGpp synthase/HD superfamily hydrolase